MGTLGFIVWEVVPDLAAIPTINGFVKVTEDKLVALGTHNSTDGDKSLLVTDFEGFKDGENEIYNDILLDTEQ